MKNKFIAIFGALLVLVFLFITQEVSSFDAYVAWTSTAQDDGLTKLVQRYCLEKTGPHPDYSPICSFKSTDDPTSCLEESPLFTLTGGTGGDFFDQRITVPEDLKLVTDDGSVVGSELCAGDRFRFEKGALKGEFWAEGGDLDSPPIYWVDNVEDFALKLVDFRVRRAQAGQDVYTPIYPPKLFSIKMDNAPANEIHIVYDKSSQASISSYLRFIGYPQFSDELDKTDYTIKNLDPYEQLYSNNPYGKVILTEDSKEIGSISFSLFDDLWHLEINGANIPIGVTSYLESKDKGYDVVGLYFPDGFIDRSTGMRLYGIWSGANASDLFQGGVVCSLVDNGSSVEGVVSDGQYYKASSAGNIKFEKILTLDCILYEYGYSNYTMSGLSTGYVLVQMPALVFFTAEPESFQSYSSQCFENKNASLPSPYCLGQIPFSRDIKVVDPAKPNVEVSVVGANSVNLGSPNTFRVLVKNTGNIDVSIKSVYSNPSGKLVSCDSDNLAPNQQAECLLSVTPVQGQGLSVQVSYDYKSCGRSQTGLVTKTLIDSKTFRPVLKEQSYLMGVHGACDNNYFSCYSASEGSLFAGYKCYKTSNGFYAPATERINLRFDLFDIPKKAEILGAKLYLKASEVGGKQTVNVYSVNKIPEAVKCLPGGDICTKPYCGECKPIYELDGTVASSAEISSAGQYSFDLTNQLKDKLARDGIFSLQIRGAEGLWESQGQSSCTIENDWDKRDVSFDAGGRDGPYLEVVYQ